MIVTLLRRLHLTKKVSNRRISSCGCHFSKFYKDEKESVLCLEPSRFRRRQYSFRAVHLPKFRTLDYGSNRQNHDSAFSDKDSHQVQQGDKEDSFQDDVDDNNTEHIPEKVPKRTLDQAIYHMQADIRRKRRIHKAEIHNAIELVEKAVNIEDFGVFLLSCCCDILPDFPPTYRVGLAQRIWTVIQKSKAYSPEHFEAMLKALALNEDEISDPFEYLEEAEKIAGVTPTPAMYYFALLIVCQRGDIEGAVKVLNRMKEKGLSLNEKFFSALILGYSRHGDLKGAREVLEVMTSSHIEPSKFTWANLLLAYVEAGDIKMLRNTFSGIIRSTLDEDQYYDLLKAAGRQSNHQILDVVIEFSVASGKINPLSIMNVTLQLMYFGQMESAMKIIFRFADTLKAKDKRLGWFFIKELHAAKLDPETYLNNVMSLQGENRNQYALNIAAESCLKHRKFNLAFKVFEGMLVMNIPIRPHYFLPVFITELEENKNVGAAKVFEQMRKVNISPDWDMLVDWIIPSMFEKEGDMLEVAKIIQEGTGLSYSSGILTAAITVALRFRKLEEAMAMVTNLKGKVIRPEAIIQALIDYVCESDGDVQSDDLLKIAKILQFLSENVSSSDNWDHVGHVMLKLTETDRCAEAEALLPHLSKFRLSVTNETAEGLQQRIPNKMDLQIDGKLKSYEINGSGNGFKRMLHPDDMNLTDLECHKEELESKSFNTRGTLRKLFLKYCQSGELLKALETKKNFELESGELSPGMKSALMGNYVRNGAVEESLHIFQEIQHKSSVDVYKIIDLTTLMVEKGMKAEAIDLLHEECSSRKAGKPESYSRNVVCLLDALSRNTNASDEDNSVYSLTEFLLSRGFIKATNPTLAPAVKDLIRKDKLEEAVLRLETYTSKYNLTPCLTELTYAVLKKRPDLLEKVTSCSAAAKGVEESKRSLAYAKSDLGDIDGAATIFTEMGPQLRFPAIIRQCEYVASRKEWDKLLNLINAIHKTGGNYDCNVLYETAIKACKRSGDKETLKRVLSNMEEYDLYVPPALRQIVS